MSAGVGKIEDIFANRGLTDSNHTGNNHDGVDGTIQFIKTANAVLFLQILWTLIHSTGIATIQKGYRQRA